ncbi:MAG: gliding motility protein Gldf [Bergeyella sp.]|nr:gliding motility protein Gldf [Bergeyella sp.]
MFSLYKKELFESFGNGSASVIVGIFSVLCVLFLFFFETHYNLLDIGIASLYSYFILVPWIFMFLIPAISMKSFTEESRRGTLVWLFSQPVSIRSILLGKLFFVWTLGLLCLLPSIVYVYTVDALSLTQEISDVDAGALLGGYIGAFFLCGAFSALGNLAALLSENPITAYLLGVFFCFFMYFGIEQLSSYRLMGTFDYAFQSLGLYKHYINFSRGLIDSKDVFYFITVVLICYGVSEIKIRKKK